MFVLVKQSDCNQLFTVKYKHVCVGQTVCNQLFMVKYKHVCVWRTSQTCCRSCFYPTLALDRAPTIFNKFTPMNSWDVFLYSSARSMFILALRLFFVSVGSPPMKVCIRALKNLATPLFCSDLFQSCQTRWCSKRNITKYYVFAVCRNYHKSFGG